MKVKKVVVSVVGIYFCLLFATSNKIHKKKIAPGELRENPIREFQDNSSNTGRELQDSKRGQILHLKASKRTPREP